MIGIRSTADIRQKRSDDCVELIVQKAPKIRTLIFSPKSVASEKLAILAQRAALENSHIAKASIWPNPWPNFLTGALWRIFSAFFGENGVFQHNLRNPVLVFQDFAAASTNSRSLGCDAAQTRRSEYRMSEGHDFNPSGLGSSRPSEASQHLGDLISWVPHGTALTGLSAPSWLSAVAARIAATRRIAENR